MKKILAIILTVSVMLTLCACASQPSSQKDVYYEQEIIDNQIEYIEGNETNSVQGGTTNSFNNQTSNHENSPNQNSSINNNSSNTTANKNNTNTNKNNSYNSSYQNSSTDKETPTVNPDIIYQSINWDRSFFKNKAQINSIKAEGKTLYINFTILEHNGGNWDSFATDAIFYDESNNIIDMKIAMYVSNIGGVVGCTYDDEIRIPTGTKTILINSGTTDVNYKVSSNYGNSSISLNIPTVCYDNYKGVNSVEVKSYNVFEERLFLTYAVKSYGNTGYTTHSTRMLFYDSNNNIIDDKIALYASQISSATVGKIYFDDTRIPSGTVRIEVKANSPASSGGSSTGGSSSGSTWSVIHKSTLKSRASTMVSVSSELVVVVTSCKVGISSGGSFGIGMANTDGARAKNYVSKIKGYLQELEPIIQANSDLSFVKIEGDTVYLKSTFYELEDKINQLSARSLSGASSIADAEEYLELANEVLLLCSQFNFIAKNN